LVQLHSDWLKINKKNALRNMCEIERNNGIRI
jgi:hypothetical protein